MVRFRRAFDLDFEALVRWAVLAHQDCVHPFPPGAPPSQVLNEEGRLKGGREEGLRPIRLRHLSEITGIARETTRRKLVILKNEGWIVQGRSDWVVNREKVGPELRAFSRETVRRFLRAARARG